MLLAAVATTSSSLHAVGTRQFKLDTLDSLKGGDLTGVSVASDGTVRAGWTLGELPVTDATSVWCSVALRDGSVLLGTGSEGKIYRVSRGKVTVAVETGAMAVSAMTLAWDGDVVAGTFPDGKLYRFAQNAPDGTKPNPLVTLKETEDVWALAYDVKTKGLYAATGPEGRLFRIEADGKAEIYFDSEESHLVSAAVDADGTVYAGSNGKALLYRLTGPGRHTVVYDFDGDDVKGIAVAPGSRGGAVYAIANEYSGSMKGLRSKRSSRSNSASPQSTKPPKPGKGTLMRFDKRGVAEKMLHDKDTHFVSLSLDDEGRPFVGTGAEGQVYTVDDDHVVQLMADTEERQVGAMMLVGAKRYLATSDPVVFHEITGRGGQDAVWTSKPLDAHLRAHFGLLEWRSLGQLELSTRTGNTEKPDDSWSAWSAPVATPSKIQSPAARYLQIRARWSRDPRAELQEVTVSFVTDNARALLTEVTVGDSSSSSSSKDVPASGGSLDDPDPKLKVKWKVDNPDNDELRYRVLYRALDGKHWFSALDADEVLTKTELKWDTTGLPEGRYVLRVDASDELANPPGRTTSHRLESRPVLVDNTPPVLSQLTLRANRLSGTATDGAGPIARIEFSLVGSKSWRPLFPTDGVFDQATESFDGDLTGLLPPGPQVIVVQAFDSAGNRVTRSVSAGGR
jgi:hypothetical protein